MVDSGVVSRLNCMDRYEALLRRTKMGDRMCLKMTSRPASRCMMRTLALFRGRRYSVIVSMKNNDYVSATGTVTILTAGNNCVNSCVKKEGLTGGTPMPRVTVPAATKANSRTASMAIVAGSSGSMGVVVGRPTFVPDMTVISPLLAVSSPGGIASTAKISTLDRTVRTCLSGGTRPVASAVTMSTVGLVIRGVLATCGRKRGISTHRTVDLNSLRTKVTFSGTSMYLIRKVDHPVKTLFRMPRKVSGTVLLPTMLRFDRRTYVSHLTSVKQVFRPSGRDLAERRTTRVTIRSIGSLYLGLGVPGLEK